MYLMYKMYQSTTVFYPTEGIVILYIYVVDELNDSSITMKAVMMERTVAKVTCGVTSVSHRGVPHRVARSSMGIDNSSINGLRKGRMVAMQAKKAPEMPPVVSPTQGEVSRVEISSPQFIPD